MKLHSSTASSKLEVPPPHDPITPIRKSRSILTLRAVIGAFTATIVLAVAVIVFAVTYTASLETVDSIGERYAKSLVAIAQSKSNAYFEVPASHIESARMAFRRPGFMLPSEDNTTWTVLENAGYVFQTLANAYIDQYFFFSSIWDDGSVGSWQPLIGQNIGALSLMNARFITNTTSRCCGRVRHWEFRLPSMDRIATTPTHALSVLAGDARFAAYVTTKNLLQTFPLGMWGSVSYTPTTGWFLPIVCALNNATHFLGLGTAGMAITTVRRFLREIEVTEGSHIFALDPFAVFASTHPAQRDTFTNTTSNSYVPGPHCYNSGTTEANASVTVHVLACRQRVAEFPYAPLQAVASDRTIIAPRAVTVQKRKVDKEAFYIAAAPVVNRMALFSLSLVVFMPEQDILGDIVARRNAVIGITCAVIVFAAAASFALVFAVLKPLAAVSARMRRTARLQDDSVPTTPRDGDLSENFSALAEIQDLQVAYTNMNTAIRSFTRYVPRDVVKDLMVTGQLCEIKMAPLKCTMLFVDIAGFTTMCERVPADELSELVRIYFEQMSSIVMRHDGLIDKFIGDSIMAVWGAPFAVANQEVKATLCAALIAREATAEPLAPAFDSVGEVLHVRVGVATGDVLAGNMGSQDRMNYTVIGDAVNLAARLESLNKQFGTAVMIAESTAGGLPVDLFVLRLLMRIAVVGKDTAVKVFELVGLVRNCDPTTLDELRAADDARSTTSAGDDYSVLSEAMVSTATPLRRHRLTSELLNDALALQDYPLIVSESEVESAQLYTEAVRRYVRAEFAAALEALDRAMAASPKRVATVAAQQLRDSCETHINNPPGADFDGVWRALQK